MDMIHYIAWFALVSGEAAVLQLLQLPLRRKAGVPIIAVSFVLKGFAAVAIAFYSIAVYNRMMWNLGYLPGALYAVLLCDAAVDLVALFIAPLRNEPKRIVKASAVLTAIFVLYGTINIGIIMPKEHTYTSDKLRSTHKFIYLSDLHYGSSQRPETVDKVLSKITEQKPEFLLLGGDITDERTTAAEMRQIYEKLGELNIPTYFIYGNHDRQEHGYYIGGTKYTEQELKNAITGNGIKILRDDFQVISEDLVVLGREDFSAGDNRCAVSDLPKLPKDAYTICLDHSPYQEDDICATGADLQLSGHTHAGQVFPLQYVYRLGVNNIYGNYKFGDTDVYVSSGISGWYYPFRTSAHCNYEIITLRPEN